MIIQFSLDTNDAVDAALIHTLLTTPAGSVPGAARPKESRTSTESADEPKPKPAAQKPKAETPAAKKKRVAAEKKAAADAAADEKRAADAAAATEADDLLVDGPAEVTIDELKAVVKATIERVSVDKVKEIFTAHAATNISGLPTESYAEVKAELEAL